LLTGEFYNHIYFPIFEKLFMNRITIITYYIQMKHLNWVLILLITGTLQAQIGIGTNTPAASAALDVTSTAKGFLPPRLTYAQKSTIASPVAGLIVWCTDCGNTGELQVYNGTTWTNMIGNTANTAKPSAPTNVVATASNTQASVAFTLSISDGGNAITGYTVTATPGNITVTGSSSPILVTGLTNGTPYVFSVFATNSSGNSAPSDLSAAVVPKTVPSAPTSVVATSGNLKAIVAFEVPSSNGGSAITSYKVTASPGSFAAIGTSSPIEVPGLTNGTSYTFTVVALNSEGESASSLTSAAVVPSFVCGRDGVTFTYKGSQVTYGTVVAANSRCWLDRNLGASQVATSSTDSAAYGDLFQWGRGDDGHQSRTSTNTNVLSTTDTPGHGSFITTASDWRSPSNNDLWQGVNGVNNPCPSGYRLPSSAEWTTERNSWSSIGGMNATGAFASNLKLTLTGYRWSSNGTFGAIGTEGVYFTSSNGTGNILRIYASNNSFGNWGRGLGNAIRCIKE
jgi:hypothetical protein